VEHRVFIFAALYVGGIRLVLH